MANYFNELDRIGLEQLGIGFETERESFEFEWIIQEELKARIGVKISNKMSKEQKAEYDRLYDPIMLSNWLAENYPNYRDLVAMVANQLKKELLLYKNKIAGHMSTLGLKINGVLVDEIDMTNETRGKLKKAGVITFGEMAGIRDLSSIDTLTPRNVREVEKIVYLVHKEGIKTVLI